MTHIMLDNLIHGFRRGVNGVTLELGGYVRI